MKYLLLIAALFVAQVQAEIVQMSDRGMWYKHGEIGGTGLPSYSGNLATATNKTMPIAVKANDNNIYYTYSTCEEGKYKIWVTRGKDERIIFRSDYCDQHDNAAIRVATDGYIWIYKAARGFWRKSYTFKSKSPYSITNGFDVVDSDYRAYPQAWSMGLIYTRYNEEKREPWVKSENCDKKLVSGGHYNVSYYDGEFIHMFYNYHKESEKSKQAKILAKSQIKQMSEVEYIKYVAMTADLNHRINLYYMRSANGCDWQNINGEALSLPLDTDSDKTRVYKGDEFIYLKDIKVVNGVPRALVAKSTTWNPTTGTRELYEIDSYGNETYITNQNHNYDGAAYFGNNSQFIVAVKSRDFGYTGGAMFFYHKGEEIGGISNGNADNYPRKIIGFRGFLFSGSSSSIEDNGDSAVYMFK
tara:strand:+ start:942 stop:2183 length:1242 start_codon:yes stop_codon:yes gene_type:complete